MKRCTATCGTCGEVLNRTRLLPDDAPEAVVEVSATLNCLCKTAAHNTYSDCNLNIKTEWERGIDGEAMIRGSGACSMADEVREFLEQITTSYTETDFAIAREKADRLLKAEPGAAEVEQPRSV